MTTQANFPLFSGHRICGGRLATGAASCGAAMVEPDPMSGSRLGEIHLENATTPKGLQQPVRDARRYLGRIESNSWTLLAVPTPMPFNSIPSFARFWWLLSGKASARPRKALLAVGLLIVAADMAKVLGESGRYVTDQSAKKWHRQFLVLFLANTATASLGGVLIGYVWRNRMLPPLLVLALAAAMLILFWLIYRSAMRKWDELERSRISFRKGATGEAVVARILADFPDNYVVINDLATPYRNLDHVVVGPTGVFVIETKNFKGTIKADGKGGILVNERPPEKPVVKTLVARVMNVRDKIATLCDSGQNGKNGLPWFNGVLAFPSARVEARWRETGSVDCVTDERLWDYIVESKKGKVLERPQIDRLAQAFLALATMDKEFTRNLNAPRRAQPLTAAMRPSGRAVAAEAA